MFFLCGCIFWTFSSLFSDRILKTNQNARSNNIDFGDDGMMNDDDGMDPAMRVFNKKQKEMNIMTR